ncbi:MAG: hypothetical protein A2275_10400 [Bacteroidetes bacterium RIFOXYA12_FULL_35_11]|nr:MAG: hypothetical protein A2X01_18675 [Bacteroidetes bacterium GWF2_35_48]OFY75472.1 MAG: hypothetical protein A2275_10400 [Bacteroidetes bacterium RIFOXYA12_FULL_35_11]OFY95755.1 MAG: hypothetical protein A2309_02175 [Bacteroidetes bacterium RIFOXYB2_FULL_35_7]
MLFFLFYLTVNAQQIQCDLLVGDTLNINVEGVNGTIQWQESTDSLTWLNILNETLSSIEIIVPSSVTGYKFYRAEIIDSLCPNASPYYSNCVKYKIISNTSQVQIGEWFHGGIVFNTYSNGSGLIAPQVNQEHAAEWGCYSNNLLLGAVSLSDGASNTDTIVLKCNQRPIAASVCDTLNLNGFDDWFLPAINQLDTLWDLKDIVGGFYSGSMWSSSESDANSALTISYLVGYPPYPVTGAKNNILSVRCIRNYTNSESIGHYNYFDTIINQPVTITINQNPLSQLKCKGSSTDFTVDADGSEPFSYQWIKDGIMLSDANESVLQLENISVSDEGFYSCEVSNLCRSVLTNSAELKVIDISIVSSPDTVICKGDTSALLVTAVSNHPAESGTLVYNWSPSMGISNVNSENPNAYPIASTNYVVSATEQTGCSGIDSTLITVRIPFANQQLCYVTVDTITWRNKIIWEKTPGVGIASYCIWVETTTEHYERLACVNHDNPANYVDVTSSPEVKAYKYKISVIDTCGNESDYSFFHKTMKLIVNTNSTNANLQWSSYIDESGTYVPEIYIIYRSTSTTTFDSINYTPGSEGFINFTDPNGSSLYYYMVGVKKTDGCNSSKENESVISFSNYKKGANGVSEILFYNKINIYPNPFHDETTVDLNDKMIKSILIKDITGKIVKDYSNINQREVKLYNENLTSGIYLIEVYSDNLYRNILIVE